MQNTKQLGHSDAEEQRPYEGWPALMEAAWRGQEEIVREMITRGAIIDSMDDRGHTALTRAACKGNSKIVQILLEAGADPYVNQVWKKEFLVDDPVAESNTRGRVAFAKGGRHTRTTEIFISYKDNSALDEEGFAPIGEVVEGMDVVDAFYSEYGDGPPRGDGPYQAMAQARGNEYLDADFPELTRILSATVTPGS